MRSPAREDSSLLNTRSMSTSIYDNGRSQDNRPGPALDNLYKVTS